jgi:hypothetical protein
MKRLITTAGLAALGAASVAPTCAQDAMINQKPWSIGASLRGFYDDNYLTYPRALRDIPGFDEDTFGFDISPSAGFNIKREQTTFGISYLYTLRYYLDREDDEMDHTHQANMKLSHAFNERFSIDVKDSFVIAQEPSILDPTISTTLPARAEGDNVRNFGSIQFNAAVVENFSVNAGYRNAIFDYEEDSDDYSPGSPRYVGTPVFGAVGTRSAVLDRMEHLFFIDGNYQVLPKTTVSLGYQFGIIDYTSEDALFGSGVLGNLPPFYNGNARDNKSHFATVGVKQHLNPQLDVSVRGGIQFTTYDNETLFDDVVSPYAEASVRWGYSEGSSLQVGARHQRIPTDVRLAGGVPIADQEATTVWVSVNQAITGKLSAIIMGQYQYSTYGDSSINGDAIDAVDQIFFAGATLAYQFNPHVSAELGYTFDRVDSDFQIRSFTRNRVYVGTRLSY